MQDGELLATFDDRSFSLALDAIRQDRGLSRREVAQQSGVSPSTITRVAQGKLPDVDSFAALVVWMGRDANDFIIRPHAVAAVGDRFALTPLELVHAALAQDERLSDGDIHLIYSVASALIRRLRTEPAEE